MFKVFKTKVKPLFFGFRVRIFVRKAYAQDPIKGSVVGRMAIRGMARAGPKGGEVRSLFKAFNQGQQDGRRLQSLGQMNESILQGIRDGSVKCFDVPVPEIPNEPGNPGILPRS